MNRNNKIVKNASWIIGCRIVQAVLNLLIGMFTARYLGPSDYGLISYAASIVAFVTPLANLGINNTLVNEFVHDPRQDHRILGTSICMSGISAVCCMVGIAVFVGVVHPDEPVTRIVCVLYSLSLLAQSLELVRYWFQARYMSQYTAVIMLAAYFLVSVYRLILLMRGKNVYWFAVANALDYVLIAVALLALYRKFSGKRLAVSPNMVRRLFSNSRHYILSGMMVTVFAQTDRIMIKLMIDEAAVGWYSAAVTVAGMTSFIFGAIIDSMRPAILESKTTDPEAYKSYMKKLYCIVIYFALAQSAVITVFSGLIVRIMYGSAYLATVDALRIIVWYTTFSYLGAVRNVWILAEGQQKYLWMINLSGAAANVVLNLLLIPGFGICGAAAASLVTQIFTNVIVGFIIPPIRANNRLMLESLNIPGVLKK